MFVVDCFFSFVPVLASVLTDCCQVVIAVKSEIAIIEESTSIAAVRAAVIAIAAKSISKHLRMTNPMAVLSTKDSTAATEAVIA